MIDWLAAPLDTARAHEVGFHLSWHARTMVLAWAVLVPVGILVARYFKVLPGQDWPRRLDSPWWWITHRVAQYSAGMLMLAGLWLILAMPEPAPAPTSGAWLHRLVGWAVLSLAAAQFTSGWLRGTKGGPTAPAPDGSLRGDHFDMTPRRKAFEYIHKFGGVLALCLSVAVIVTGLWQANAPRWMGLGLAVWWAGLLLAAMVLERRRGAFDTYQAIWGPDDSLPGNRMRPIGLKVTRDVPRDTGPAPHAGRMSHGE
ncbi:MAG: cytochrome b561 domain-containing protein [Pseudorhodobacter sp.]